MADSRAAKGAVAGPVRGLEAGVPIYDVQKLLGHSRIETTMIYNHVALPAEKRIKSPLESL